MSPSHFVTVPAVLEEDNGQEVETGSMLQILLVDFGIGILPFLREFDLVTVAMESQPFSADGVDFLPLSSSLLTSALEWLQVASKNRPSFIPLQRKPSQLPRQSRRLHVLLQRGLLRGGGPRQHLQTALQFLNACHTARALVPVSQCSWSTSFQITGFSFAKGPGPVRSPTKSRRRAWVHSIRGSVLGASGPKQTSADGRCFDVAEPGLDFVDVPSCQPREPWILKSVPVPQASL